MGQEALGPRSSKCHRENGRYFSNDLEEPQIVENGPEGSGAGGLDHQSNKNTSVLHMLCCHNKHGLKADNFINNHFQKYANRRRETHDLLP